MCILVKVFIVFNCSFGERLSLGRSQTRRRCTEAGTCKSNENQTRRRQDDLRKELGSYSQAQLAVASHHTIKTQFFFPTAGFWWQQNTQTSGFNLYKLIAKSVLIVKKVNNIFTNNWSFKKRTMILLKDYN